MASKVNSKFVVFLILALGVAGIVVGGLYYLNIRHNADRAVRRGDEALQKGDFHAARDFYGRAIHKEPGNLGYLQKFEDVTAKIQPRTADEAKELYNGWLGILAHGARHDAENSQRHLRLLRELSVGARRTGAQWNRLEAPAKDMLARLPEGHPDRPLGTVYQCMSVFRRASVVTPEELLAAEAEMEKLVETFSTNDLAWGTLIHGHTIILDRMSGEWGRSQQMVEEQNTKIDQDLEKALAQVPNGPEIAKMKLFRMITHHRADPTKVTKEQVQQSADVLAAAVMEETDAGLLGEAANLVSLVPDDGIKRSIAMEERFLEKNPDALDIRLSMASLCYVDDNLERAEQIAQDIIKAPTLPVGFMSQIQHEWRKRAAGLVADIKCRYWTRAKPEDRPAIVKQMDEAREQLASLVTDPANDIELLRADARQAYTRGEYARSAKFFEKLVRETAYGQDAETLYFAAMSLQNITQYGLAHERIEQALKLRPDTEPLLIFKARLELIMGRRADATATIAKLPQTALENPEVVQLISALKSMSTSSPAMANTPEGQAGAEAVAVALEKMDPITVILNKSSALMNKGEIDNARAILQTALAESPQNVQLLRALILVESRAGKNDKVKEYVARAIELLTAEGRTANDVDILRLQAILKFDDPIAAMREFHMQAVPDETERALSMLDNLRALILEQQALAARSARVDGKNSAEAAANEEVATKANELVARAKTELKEWLAKAQQLAPDNPRLLNFQLDEALEARDWAPGGAVEQIIARAKAVDADQAGGMFFKGRAEIAKALDLLKQGKTQEGRAVFEEAVRSLEITTDRAGFNARAWRALAFSYQQLGNFAQAQRAFEQAYKCNPTDLEVVRSYVDHLLRRTEQVRALTILREARQLWPSDQQFRNLFLQLEVEVGGQGGRGVALNARRAIYKEFPEDLVNAAEFARLLSTTEPSLRTILDSAGNQVYTEGRWNRMFVEEREQALKLARAQWNTEIDSIVDILAKTIGADNLEIVTLRSTLLRERGDVVKGEEMLENFIKAQGENVSPAMYIELARYQVKCSHFKEAMDSLKEGLKHQKESQTEVDRELADLYLRLRVPELALQHFDAVLAVADDRNTQQRAIECLIKLGRYEDAEKRLQKVVKDGGDDLISILLTANIAEAKGDALVAKGDASGAERQYAELRDILTRAQAHDPSSPTPRLLLAQFFTREYKRTGRVTTLEDALRALEDAERLRADQPEVSLMRVSIFKERGDKEAAIGELRRFVDRNPDHHLSRGDLAQLYVEIGQIDAAFAVLDEGIKRNPTLTIWYDAQGDLYKLARADAGKALESYKKSYELNKTAEGMMKIADAMLAMKTPDCRGLIGFMNTRPDDLATMPGLQEMHARALQCAGRRAEAIDQMKVAYATRKELIKDEKMAPGDIMQWFQSLTMISTDLETKTTDVSAAEQLAIEICGSTMDVYELRSMAKIFLTSGDATLSRSIEFLRRAIETCPADEKKLKIALYSELASYYYGIKKMQDAVDCYDAILAIDADNIEALNNSAYLSADELKNPTKAIPLAERVVALAAGDPSVLDTAGWTYFLAGDNDRAQKTLSTSYQSRKTLVTGLHLIEVLVKRNGPGDLTDAQVLIDDGKRMNPDPESKKKLEAFESEIQQKRTSP